MHHRTDTLVHSLSDHTASVLRNTYALLGLTILFSATTATLTMAGILPSLGFFGIILSYGLLFLVHRNAHSSAGLWATFGFTGVMGMSLGPMLNMILLSAANGGQIIATSLAATGLIFLALSAYVLNTRQCFNYMGGTLFALIFVGFFMSILGLVLQMPMIHLLAASIFTLVSSALILFHTSAIIHGYETNYILATINIYVALYNIFVSLLQIFMSLQDRD